jgi:DNA-binding PadR family transcriptional regulator
VNEAPISTIDSGPERYLDHLGMRGNVVKGHLDLLLLAIVAARPTHGYGIIEELRHRRGDRLDLPEGTVYPALHRLEGAGLLGSRWDKTHRPGGSGAFTR